MSEQLFKALIRFPADTAGPHALGSYAPLLLRSHNASKAAHQMMRVFDWLEENGREDHFVNFYDNTNDETGEGQLLVVLNNRDTAIMLKLALR